MREISFTGNRSSRTEKFLLGRFQRYYPHPVLTRQSLAGKRVLDIGCGDAEFVGGCQAAKAKATGIDLFGYLAHRKTKSVSKAIRKSWKNGWPFSKGHLTHSLKPLLGNLLKGNGLKLPFADKVFDFCFNTCSFLTYPLARDPATSAENKRAMLREAARVLKLGGEFHTAPVSLDEMVFLLQDRELGKTLKITEALEIPDAFDDRNWSKFDPLRQEALQDYYQRNHWVKMVRT